MAQPEKERTDLHHCALALTPEQAEHVRSRGTLLQAWFGNGWSVPVKNNIQTAVEAFMEANKEFPDKALQFRLPLPLYHKWMDEGKMQVCPWVNGYRIKGDIDLTAVDFDFMLHSLE